MQGGERFTEYWGRGLRQWWESSALTDHHVSGNWYGYYFIGKTSSESGVRTVKCAPPSAARGRRFRNLWPQNQRETGARTERSGAQGWHRGAAGITTAHAGLAPRRMQGWHPAHAGLAPRQAGRRPVLRRRDRPAINDVYLFPPDSSGAVWTQGWHHGVCRAGTTAYAGLAPRRRQGWHRDACRAG
eukprot:gene16571-biopygen748